MSAKKTPLFLISEDLRKKERENERERREGGREGKGKLLCHV